MEQNLLEHQRFIMSLADAVHSMTDERQIKSEASRRLGEYLQASRVLYAEPRPGGLDTVLVDQSYQRDVAPMSGTFRCSDFGLSVEKSIRDAYLTVEDTRSRAGLSDEDRARCVRFSIRAFMVVPVVREERLEALLCIHYAQPHVFGDMELHAAQETAMRTWSEVKRVRAEGALRESEAQLRLALDVAELGTWSWDLTDGTGHLDARAAYLLGTEPGFLANIAEVKMRMFHPDDIPRVRREITSAMTTNDAFTLTYRTLAPEGSVRHLVSRVRVLLDAQSQPVRLMGTTRDVTSEREWQARQTLLLNLSDRLRTLGRSEEIMTEGAHMLGQHLGVAKVIYVAVEEDEDHCVIEAIYNGPGLPLVERGNRFTLNEFGAGWRPALRLGKELFCEDSDHDPERLFDAPVLRTFGIRAGAVLPLLKEGRLVACLVVEHPEPRLWTWNERMVCREVAERIWASVNQRRTETALQEGERRFRALVQHVRDYALFGVDPEGLVIEWTEGACRMLGYTAEEILGKPSALFHVPTPQAADECADQLREARSHGRSEVEGWRQRKDGTRFWVNDIATLVRDAEGKLLGFAKVCRDLSVQKRIEAQRAQLLDAATDARARAEEANRAKDEFLATLSHELRTPLAPILIWARALRAGRVSPEEMEPALSAIVQSAESQSRLIEDLLDLTRLQAGKVVLSPQVNWVASVVRHAMDVVRPLAQAKGVSLELDVQPEEALAVLDSGRLQQVLWNLLSNAVKFTATGGHAKLRVRRDGDTLEAQVTDTGEGISPDFLPHLFQRFRQANMSESRSHAGLGIGLALARHLVELLGGTLTGTSPGSGKGSTFTVRIPWQEPPSEELPEPVQAPLHSPSVLGVRVLVVEDDPSTRHAMRWTLEQAGAQVTATSSGVDALEALQTVRENFQVLVCDIGLPQMSGFELMERVASDCRARGQEVIPACAVSAHAREVDRQRAMEAGFRLHIPKPVHAEALLSAVEALAVPRR